MISTTTPIDRLAPADWVIQQADPVDAFGAAGPYDPWKLKRLFGGNRVRVARGWRVEDDVVSAFTLLSPYPDPDFGSLNAGTLVIRFIDRR